ncbi:MAG: hypothetical protein HUJ51_02390 [Eggerthellaceae bacterium]|nr:hypothetical protein [Eggerthellaceae bacterium]
MIDAHQDALNFFSKQKILFVQEVKCIMTATVGIAVLSDMNNLFCKGKTTFIDLFQTSNSGVSALCSV